MSLKTMLNRCWSKSFSERPPMKEIAGILKQEIAGLRGGNDKGLEHTRRRSTFIFQPPPPCQPQPRSLSV
jgi:hypothetical protein